MKYVILDTNILMASEEFSFNIFSELNRLLDFQYKLITLKPVVEELKKISKNKGKKGVAAKVGLKLLKDVKIIDVNSKNADKVILKFAKENDALVCTNDKELKNKLKEKGINIIYLRSKDHLELA